MSEITSNQREKRVFLQKCNKIGYYRVILIFMVFRKNLMEQGKIENFKFFAKKLIQINGPIIGGGRGVILSELTSNLSYSGFNVQITIFRETNIVLSVNI